MSSPSSRFSLLALLSAALVFGACNCEEPVAPVGDDNHLPIGEGEGEGEGEQPEHRVLLYVGEPQVTLIRGASTSVHFSWKTVSGQPVDGDNITFTVDQPSAAGVVSIDADARTSVNGGVDVEVTAGVVDGTALVSAHAVDFDGTPKLASAAIAVVEDPLATLEISVESSARIDVTTAAAHVFVGASVPTCAQLLSTFEGALAGDTFEAPFAPLPATRQFQQQPTGSQVAVMVYGKNQNGIVVGTGCATAPRLAGGAVTSVHVVVDQGDTVVAGDYDVLMHVALGDALPAPYDETVEILTALLADPAGYAIYNVLAEIDRGTDGFTFFVTRDGVLQTFRQVEQATAIDPNSFPTYSLARARLEQELINQLGPDYVDVTNVGRGIRDVATDFEVGARFALDAQPGDAGALSVAEQWKDIVLFWPLPCASGDLACARRPLTLDDLSLSPVTTSYGASYALSPTAVAQERFAVTTDPHGLNVRYGALLLAILNQVVFPSLPPDLAGGSFGDVLSNMVGCADIANSVSDDPLAALLVESFCEAALQNVADQVEGQLLDLEVSAVGVGDEGLQAGGTFTLTDVDQDLETEKLSDYLYQVAWNDPADPVASADIAAPIFGDGLRVLPACTDDAACPTEVQGPLAGLERTCQPRATYLKVAAAELVCMRSHGALAGGSSCAADDDCASGLCEPVGVAGALACFEACDQASDCSGGAVCSSVGGVLDLDGVLSGLGDVALPGCHL